MSQDSAEPAVSRPVARQEPAALEKWISFSVAGSIVASTVSIAVSSILLGATFLLWLAQVARGRKLYLRLPPFKWPLAAFVGAVALSIVFSLDPLYSASYATRIVKLALVVFTYTYLSRRQVEITLKAIIAVVSASALYGIAQYQWLLEVSLLNRIRGFMSHWMTFSGQLMVASVCAAVLILTWRSSRSERPGPGRTRETVFWTALLLVMLVALLLTFTRNAWVGTVVGMTALLVVVNWRLLIPGVLLLALLLLFLPGQFKNRLMDSFNLRDTTTQSRLELLETGVAMAADHPLTGVGPLMVPVEAPRYRNDTDFPNWLYQHLHNTPLQLAAEIGLIGLAAWLALWAAVLRDFWRMATRSARGSFAFFISVNAICVTLAFLSAGLLEYNFGDSELVILMVFFITAPYVVTREAPAV